MKKTVFNASVTAAALAAGVCSFATMPEGRALSGQEKIVSRGLVETCKARKSDEGCKPAQDVPTVIDPGKKVVICNAKKSFTSEWSATQQVTHSTVKYVCEGKWWECKINDNGKWAWVQVGKGDDVRCGEWSECNDEEGGWSVVDGRLVDGRKEYIEQCEKVKPPPPKE